MKKLYLIVLAVLIAFNLEAQMLAWDFNGNTGSEVFVSPTTSDVNMTASQITRGVVIATALANTYAATNWTQTNSLPDAISNSSYYQFTVKANTGFQISFSELNANFRRSATGPTTYQWKYSLDGTNFSNAGSQISYSGTENNGAAQLPINLNAISQLQDLNSTVTVTFRIYGFNAADGAGSFAFGRLNGDDIAVSGKVYPSIVVPVKLINFSAVSNGNITRFNWKVNCSSSSIKFEIQRSGSDWNYVTVYSKTETQARCAQPFDVNDNNTPEGLNFYRLKMIDIDGKISYSNTLRIENKKAGNAEIKLYPNVVSSNANLTIPSDKNYTANIIFIDNQGRQVSKMEVQLYKGTNNVSVNVSDFVPGKYYIKVIGGSEKNNTVVLIKR